MNSSERVGQFTALEISNDLEVMAETVQDQLISLHAFFEGCGAETIASIIRDDQSTLVGHRMNWSDDIVPLKADIELYASTAEEHYRLNFILPDAYKYKTVIDRFSFEASFSDDGPKILNADAEDSMITLKSQLKLWKSIKAILDMRV